MEWSKTTERTKGSTKQADRKRFIEKAWKKEGGRRKSGVGKKERRKEKGGHGGRWDVRDPIEDQREENASRGRERRWRKRKRNGARSERRRLGGEKCRGKRGWNTKKSTEKRPSNGEDTSGRQRED